jgi:hypothetical protein
MTINRHRVPAPRRLASRLRSSALSTTKLEHPVPRVKIAPCTFAPTNVHAANDERLRSAARRSAPTNFTRSNSELRRSHAARTASEKSTSMKSFQHRFDCVKSELRNRTPFSSDLPKYVLGNVRFEKSWPFTSSRRKLTPHGSARSYRGIRSGIGGGSPLSLSLPRRRHDSE